MGEDSQDKKDLAGLMKAAFERLLSHEPVVRVAFVDHPSLDVPGSVRPKEGENTIFEYGLGLPVPIDDLAITDDGIRATLSFSRRPHPTFVPWAAVVGILLPFQEEPVPSPARKPGNRPKLSLVP